MAVIVTGGVASTLLFLRALLHRSAFLAAYRAYRANLGRAILLGLEFLVAGDIVATILVEQTLESVAVLGVVVLIRTLLSFSLETEIEGRLPWLRSVARRVAAEEAAREGGGAAPSLDSRMTIEELGGERAARRQAVEPWGAGAIARLLQVGSGVTAVALSARVSASVPGSDVPQSAQTLAVVLVGAALGGRLGAATLLAYMGVGALGVPVFADGGAGWAHMVGPTGGYLLGFVAAAGAAGLAAERRWTDRFLPALGIFLTAHALILGMGWTWLAVASGPGAAWRGGVTPFLTGGAAKSLIAAGVTLGAARLREKPLGAVASGGR